MQIPSAPLGILGDGQLAMMIGEAAFARNIPFLAFGESKTSSFANAFPEKIILGNPNHSEELISFSRRCSAVTLENEFLTANQLIEIEDKSGIFVYPRPGSYLHFENKISQRRLYAEAGISSPRWMIAENDADMTLTQIEKDFSYPLVVKASRGGYDGYGVKIVHHRAELKNALQKFKTAESTPNLIEEKVDIAYEFAQGAVFDGKGGFILLPLVETVQKNGICEMVLSRPRVHEEILSHVREQISSAIRRLAQVKLCGLFHFEFFLTESHAVFINEGAPRPHNSTHLTLNACERSQFDLLVDFLSTKKLPALSSSPLASKNAAMVNILGQRNGLDYALTLPTLPEEIQVFPKLYLKSESRVGRKMGHVNLVAPSDEIDLIPHAERILKEYTL